MTYIRPYDLFNSGRLGACSDDAQAHWPRFYLLANAFARFQIDYGKIIRTAYALFQQRPTKQQISGWLREYYDHFLLFIYDDPKTGDLWGQWLTDQEDFRRHATSEELRSPAPDANEFERFRRTYVEQQRTKSHSLFTLSGIPPHSCTFLRGSGFGSGLGYGSGDGTGIGDDTHARERALSVYPSGDENRASDDAGVCVDFSNPLKATTTPDDSASAIGNDYYLHLWNTQGAPLPPVKQLGAKRASRLRVCMENGMTPAAFLLAVVQLQKAKRKGKRATFDDILNHFEKAHHEGEKI